MNRVSDQSRRLVEEAMAGDLEAAETLLRTARRDASAHVPALPVEVAERLLARARASSDVALELDALTLLPPSQEHWDTIWQRAASLDEAMVSMLARALDARWPSFEARTLPRQDLLELIDLDSDLHGRTTPPARAVPAEHARWRLVRHLGSRPGDRRVKFGSSAMARLCSCRTLAGLREVVLQGEQPHGGSTGAWLEPLVTATHLDGIERLELDRCGVGMRGVTLLAAAPHLASVRRLRLTHCGIFRDDARALAGSPLAAGLRELDLSGNALDEHSLAPLFCDPAMMATIERLKLSGISLGRADAALADEATPPALRWLAFSAPGRIDTFARSPWLRQLEHLELEVARDLTPLLDALAGGSLRELSLNIRSPGIEIVRALFRTRLPGLRSLRLRCTWFDEWTVEALEEALWLPQLEHLALDAGQLGVPLLQRLARLDRMPALRTLELADFARPDAPERVTVLLRSPTLPLPLREWLVRQRTLRELRQIGAALALRDAARLGQAELADAIVEQLPRQAAE